MAEQVISPEVRQLIEDSVPSLEALEIILLLARDPGREWHAVAIPPLLAPTVVTEAQVLQYLHVLADHRIVRQTDGQRFVYDPATPALAQAVAGIILAYHQRPVSLIRMVYASADKKNIQSFADAFRLRRGG
jgi:hypothetical protein